MTVSPPVILSTAKDLVQTTHPVILSIAKDLPNAMSYWTYIMTNAYRNVLYIGITNDLNRRYREHKSGLIDGFTKKYRCQVLVYYEEYLRIEDAIAREKQLKNWSRAKKYALIRRLNPEMEDLGASFF